MNAFEAAAGCGAQLREAREAAGQTQAEVATQLRMPLHVVVALEEEQWQRLGAPVFVRGHLRSYARLLKVDLGALLEQTRIAPVEPAQLVSHTHTPRWRRVAENMARRAVYVVITAVLAVPAWYASQGGFADTGPNTASLDEMPSGEAAPPTAGSAPQLAAAAPAVEKTPYIASIAPVSRAPQALTGRTVVLDFKGDSWAEISAPDGSPVEKALIRAGQKRSYKPGEVGRVVLGNASVVEVQHAGSTVDITPYKRANVARFTVSSDGSVAPFSP